MKTIALVGNPNAGKSSVFNILTGSNVKVGNYPGVTVDSRVGALKVDKDNHPDVQLVDIPGTYSLGGISPDEKIASSIILGTDKTTGSVPDMYVCIVDATALDRALLLVTQIIDLGKPVVVALNMSDLLEKRGVDLKVALLERELGVKVIKVSGKTSKGIEPLRDLIIPIPNQKVIKGDGYKKFSRSEIPEGTTTRSKSKSVLCDNSIWDGYISSTGSEGGANETFFASYLPNHKFIADGYQDFSSTELQQKDISKRYEKIGEILERVRVKRQDRDKIYSISSKLDSILMHRIFGLPFFCLILGLIFQGVFSWSEFPTSLIESSLEFLSNFVVETLPKSQFRSLLVDGIIAGVGNVLVFVPQIVLLFFFLNLLEDSGYLSRVAHIIDLPMRKIGLQGRSFVPLLSSFGCAVPGILSARTIASNSDRLLTVLVAPLMSCSARLPIYAVLIAVLVPETTVLGFSLQGLTLLGLYLLGAIGAALVAFLFRKTIVKGKPAVFVLELPIYRVPSLKMAVKDSWHRGMVFVRSAASFILACSIVLWFLASYPNGSDVKNSYAGKVGQFVEPAIKPLGYNWEMGVAILSSFAAREVFVSSLATVYNLGDDDDSVKSLTEHMKKKRKDGKLSLATGLSLLVFFVFACQCMSTLAVVKSETGSNYWAIFMFAYMTILAYGSSWITYNLLVNI